jgi:hypothetical protein
MAKYIIALLLSALAGAACSGTAAAPDGGGGSTGADSPSGVVIGPLDNHCTGSDGGLTIQTVGVCQVIDPTTVPANAASCNVSFDTAGGTGDGGVVTSTDYGPTMYGSAGDDDDCKYYVSWTATPIVKNANTFFTVSALRLADMMPVSCAGVRPDVSLSISHGAPAPANPSTEIAPASTRSARSSSTPPGPGPCAFTSSRSAATRRRTRLTATPPST